MRVTLALFALILPGFAVAHSDLADVKLALIEAELKAETAPQVPAFEGQDTLSPNVVLSENWTMLAQTGGVAAGGHVPLVVPVAAE